MRARVFGVGLLTALTVLVAARDASADAERVKFLADKLKSDDFRVRTNAALALGATNEEGAVEPFCTALDDSSEVVRQAAAVAMKRLSKSSSFSCLRARESKESHEGTKVAITRAIESIGAGGGGGDAGGNMTLGAAAIMVGIGGSGGTGGGSGGRGRRGGARTGRIGVDC